MMRRYAEYRATGVEWLGEVPAGWRVERIKENSYLKGRVGWKGLTSEEFEIESFAYLVTGTDFKERFIDWSTCYQIDEARYDDDPFIQLQNGDLLITKDGTIGKLAIVTDLDKPACLNSGIFLVRPNRSYLTPFLYWVLSANEFKTFCDLTTYGSTINHLYQNVFENFAFPLPPLPEQTAIAAFLDVQTAAIDGLIEQQRRLIALLREKRQAVISHAVTRGLNPNTPLKPSGIDWLGDVPEGWEVKRLRFLTEIETGSFDTADADETADFPFFVRSETIERIGEFTHDCEAVLTSGDGAGVGKIFHHFNGKFSAHQRVYIFKDFREVSGEFFFQFLKVNFFKVALEGGAKSTVDSLRRPLIANFWITVPPAAEQADILKFIRKTEDQFDTLTTTAETAIALLQERRAALISAAVTGKIDVRDLVKQTEAA